jgi:hypothetical protein
MQTNQEEIVRNLEALRQEQGEEAYVMARMNLAKMLIFQPQGETFLKAAFPDLNLDEVREAARQGQPVSPNDLLGLIRTYVPHLTTKMHYAAFMASFEALTRTLDSYFAGDLEKGDQFRDALFKAVDASKNVHDLVEKVREIPAEQRSNQSAAFVEPPREFTEIDEQRRLLAELGAITSQEILSKWYKEQRTRIDSVVTKKYRDELFDEIRSKQQELTN